MRIVARTLWADTPAGPHRWKDGVFEVRRGRIYRVTPPNADVTRPTQWMIPGLVDVHCHIGLEPQGVADEATQRTQMETNMRSGVTVIRDCGSPVDTTVIAEAGPLTLIRSGRHIARPKRYIRHLALEVKHEDELVEAVIGQARRGNGWVKLVGDWIDRSAAAKSDLKPLWSRRHLADAVKAAHDHGARVAVHTFSHAAIDDLIAAKVDSIEHGCGMDQPQIEAAANLGIAITPTLMQVDLFGDFAAAGQLKYPRYAETMRNLAARHARVWQQWLDAGVTLLPGTDSGGYQAHGSLPKELRLWAERGLTAAQIVDWASWRARHFLGIEGLWDGAPADFVLYGQDPASNVAVLTRPQFVRTARGASWRADTATDSLPY